MDVRITATGVYGAYEQIQENLGGGSYANYGGEECGNSEGAM